MKVLVCGSRSWIAAQPIRDRVAGLEPGTIVVTGCADGADHHAAQAAVDYGMWSVYVPVTGQHWQRYGRSAGHKRNHAMLDLAPDLVIAFQVNGSNGTQGTIDEARRRGIPVEVHTA